jgi:hypothetical protein
VGRLPVKLQDSLRRGQDEGLTESRFRCEYFLARSEPGWRWQTASEAARFVATGSERGQNSVASSERPGDNALDDVAGT